MPGWRQFHCGLVCTDSSYLPKQSSCSADWAQESTTAAIPSCWTQWETMPAGTHCLRNSRRPPPWTASSSSPDLSPIWKKNNNWLTSIPPPSRDPSPPLPPPSPPLSSVLIPHSLSPVCASHQQTTTHHINISAYWTWSCTFNGRRRL